MDRGLAEVDRPTPPCRTVVRTAHVGLFTTARMGPPNSFPFDIVRGFMPRPLSEGVVKRAVQRWFRHSAPEWKVVFVNDLHLPGPDIKAVRWGHEWVIEAKGDPKPRRKPAGSKAKDITPNIREGLFIQALGQLVTRMSREKAARYGLALPESYAEKLRRIPRAAWKRLSLHVLLVNEDEQVRHLTARNVFGRGWEPTTARHRTRHRRSRR